MEQQGGYQAVPGGQVNITVQQPTETVLLAPNVIIVNRCPACQQGVLVDNFTALGIVCAIVFFPVGILCCLMLTRKRCTRCYMTFH